MICLAVTDWEVLAIALTVLAGFVAFIALARREEKIKRAQYSERKAEAMEALGGEYSIGTFKVGPLLMGFELFKTYGKWWAPPDTWNDFSLLKTEINGYNATIHFGDVSSEDGTTVFLTVVAGIDFGPQYTYANIRFWNRDLSGKITPRPLEEIFTSQEIRDLIARRKWRIETRDSRCLIYRIVRTCDPEDYKEVLTDIKRVVSELLPPKLA